MPFLSASHQNTPMSSSQPPSTDASMAEANGAVREHFIPYRRQDVIDMCLADGGLPPEQHKSFRELCEILTAYLHFDFHRCGESVRENYVWFDPDSDMRLPQAPESLAGHEEQTIELLKSLADRANYFPISTEQIQAAFDKVTLIDLSTHVDLNDFERVLCFARGDLFKPTTVKKWFGTRDIDVDVLERVILLLKFKDEKYFQSSRRKRQQRQTSKFKPGAMYLYFYKDVPKYDIELLFPNVQISMTLRQMLMFAVPAVGASIGVLFKALPQLLIVAAVLLFLLGGQQWAQRLGVDEDKITGFMPVLTATIALGAALGGLAVRQWSSYRNKYIQFLKDVGEQLFFRNLATNRAVFARLIESAEEEESKEMILVLYHLIKHSTREFTHAQLDTEIENWMQEKFGAVIDFDIDGPIHYLTKLHAPSSGGQQRSVLTVLESGHLQAASMEEVKRILDYRWDNFFLYSNESMC